MSPEPGALDATALAQQLDDDVARGSRLLAALVGSSDPALAAAARRIAGRLLIDVARDGVGSGGRPRSLHVRGWAEGELALERSLAPLLLARVSGHGVDPAALTERRRRPARDALCLVIDHSGSMAEDRLAAAALAAAAVAVRVPVHERVVLGFARHPQVLATPRLGHGPAATVERVLRLRGHGATDLSVALRAAQRHLAGLPARRRTVVLLSDARTTVGEEPTEAARAIEDLRILAPAEDADEAHRLVAAGGGRVEEITGPGDVLRAVGALLGDRQVT